MNKLEELKTIMDLLNKRTITPEQLVGVISTLVDAVKKSSEKNNNLSNELQGYLDQAISYLRTEQKKYITSDNVDEKISESELNTKKLIDILEFRLAEIQIQHGKDGVDGIDGKDGSPDTGEQIVAKINELSSDKEENQIDASHIKNLPKLVRETQVAMSRLLDGLQDVNLDGLTRDAYGRYILGSGGGGTPSGSDTQVQFNDGGSFGGDATFTFNKTTKLLTAQSISVSGLTASTSVYTDASKNLTSTAPTSGTIGYWARTSTNIYPANAGDVIAGGTSSGGDLTIASTTNATRGKIRFGNNGSVTNSYYDESTGKWSIRSTTNPLGEVFYIDGNLHATLYIQADTDLISLQRILNNGSYNSNWFTSDAINGITTIGDYVGDVNNTHFYLDDSTASININATSGFNVQADTFLSSGSASMQFVGASNSLTFSGLQVFTPASSTTRAGLNLGVGVDPTSPANGDFWNTSTHLYARIGGVTYQLDQQGTAYGVSLSSITGAVSSSTSSTNGNSQIQWSWNGLTSGTGLYINSTGTGATSNTQTAFKVASSGANSNSTQTTFAQIISNTHTGTASTNVGLQLTASGGTTNYALDVTAGMSRFHAVSTSAGTAPIYLTLGGTVMTAPEAGAIEATNTHIYWTDSGGTRYQLDQQAGSGTVTSVATGTGLTGGTITTTGTISLSTPLQPIATLTGNAGKFLRVNAGETAVEYATVSGGGITIGTTTITSGTNTRILYNNSGVVGEYTLTGSGTVVAMQTAPTFATSITTPSVLASSNDSGAIGASGTAFSDLFLASGAVINFNAGNYTLTHSAGLLTANGAFSVGTSNAITAGTIELGHATANTLSASGGVLSIEGVVIPTISSTNTLTNKRITARTGTTTSSATPTINTDDVDFYSITALAAAITSFTTNLSGTPTEGQKLWIAITDNGTARTIAWGSSFEASTVALPTTTVISTRLDVGFVWNTVTSKWRCVAVA